MEKIEIQENTTNTPSIQNEETKKEETVNETQNSELPSIQSNSKFEELIEENKKKLKSIPKEKVFEFLPEILSQNKSLFVNKTYYKIYKFQKLIKNTEKFEVILLDNTTKEEITFNCLDNNFSNFAKLKLKILHVDGKTYSINSIIDINYTLCILEKEIFNRFFNQIKSANFRILYKNLDITGRALDTKSFISEKEDQENNEKNKNKQNLKVKRNNDDIYNEDDEGENSEEIEEESCEESGNDFSQQHSDEEEEVKINSFDNSKKKEENNEENADNVDAIDQYSEKNQEKVKNSNLIDFNFNFEKDELIILVPEISDIIFNMLRKTSLSNKYKTFEIPHIFSFSRNIVIKNLLLGNSRNKKILKDKTFSLKIIEMDLDPKTDFSQILFYKSWDGHKIILDKVIGIDTNNEISSNNKLYSINNKKDTIIMNVNNIQIDSAKTYCFLFKKTDDSDLIKCYVNTMELKDEYLQLKRKAPADLYLLMGFEYKL